MRNKSAQVARLRVDALLKAGTENVSCVDIYDIFSPRTRLCMRSSDDECDLIDLLEKFSDHAILIPNAHLCLQKLQESFFNRC